MKENDCLLYNCFARIWGKFFVKLKCVGPINNHFQALLKQLQSFVDLFHNWKEERKYQLFYNKFEIVWKIKRHKHNTGTYTLYHKSDFNRTESEISSHKKPGYLSLEKIRLCQPSYIFWLAKFDPAIRAKNKFTLFWLTKRLISCTFWWAKLLTSQNIK